MDKNITLISFKGFNIILYGVDLLLLLRDVRDVMWGCCVLIDVELH